MKLFVIYFIYTTMTSSPQHPASKHPVFISIYIITDALKFINAPFVHSFII